MNRHVCVSTWRWVAYVAPAGDAVEDQVETGVELDVEVVVGVRLHGTHTRNQSRGLLHRCDEVFGDQLAGPITRECFDVRLPEAAKEQSYACLCVVRHLPSGVLGRAPVSSSGFGRGYEPPLTMASSGGVHISRKHERQTVPSVGPTRVLKPIRPSSKSAIVESSIVESRIIRPQRKSKR